MNLQPKCGPTGHGVHGPHICVSLTSCRRCYGYVPSSWSPVTGMYPVTRSSCRQWVLL